MATEVEVEVNMAPHVNDLRNKLRGFLRTAAEELWIRHYKSRLPHFSDLAEEIEFLFEHVELFVDENDRFTKHEAPKIVMDHLSDFLFVRGGGSPFPPKCRAIAWFVDELNAMQRASFERETSNKRENNRLAAF